MGAAPTRRDALRAAAIGAGAVAGAGLLRPLTALAQSSTDEDLRDFLAPTIALEQIAVFAYDAALDAKGASPDETGSSSASATRSRRTPTRCARRST